MEKAVPCQNAVNRSAELKAAHVGDDPFLFRHSLAAQRDQVLRTVDACHADAARNQIAGDRRATAAAEVEHRGAFG
jgi:hypothetical protein